MCGIIGYSGKNNTLEKLINGLKSLEYRGYDSAGIAYLYQNKIKIIKKEGKISNLEKLVNYDEQSQLGIGHTRWATHGIPNKENSHPHQVGKITLVHNGILENYTELKKELIENNYCFKSETDSEILCAYIDYLYQKNPQILDILNKIKNYFKGSYALGIMVENDKNLYAIRKDSPLIVGINDNESFIASDVPAILKHTNKYYLLENNEIAVLNQGKRTFFQNSKKITKEIYTFDGNINESMKNGYEHFMLKEINEQDEICKSFIEYYFQDKETLLEKLPNFIKYDQIHIIGCGSAYHAGLVGKYIIEELNNIPVNVEIASEYRYQKNFYTKNTLMIIISQSGETADSLACLRIAKENNIDTLAIVNVHGSSIAREAKETLYIKAGCEIAVATTKAYSMQVLMLSTIAIAINIQKDAKNTKLFEEYQTYLTQLPAYLKKEINKDYQEIAKYLSNETEIFFIGRNIDYALCLEGSLKLKEISYIHSECYPAGELKHGTISLIEKGTKIIALITKPEIKDKTISNIQELTSRGAEVILIITKSLDFESNIYTHKIVINNLHKIFNPLISIIPMQLISYYIAKEKKRDIDQPKNLAKSVTVE